jgi:hypothetical protein
MMSDVYIPPIKAPYLLSPRARGPRRCLILSRYYRALLYILNVSPSAEVKSAAKLSGCSLAEVIRRYSKRLDEQRRFDDDRFLEMQEICGLQKTTNAFFGVGAVVLTVQVVVSTFPSKYRSKHSITQCSVLYLFKVRRRLEFMRSSPREKRRSGGGAQARLSPAS